MMMLAVVSPGIIINFPVESVDAGIANLHQKRMYKLHEEHIW
jgi:hypothetical protein